MKRITTAAIAAATAMSLATVPAMAEEGSSENGGSSVASQEDNKKVKSSEIDEKDAIEYAKDNKDKAKGPVKSALDTVSYTHLTLPTTF